MALLDLQQQKLTKRNLLGSPIKLSIGNLRPRIDFHP
jgi:hypothetical protein